MNRRSFLKLGAGAAIVTLAAPLYIPAERLAFGVPRPIALPNVPTIWGPAGDQLLDMAGEHGIFSESAFGRGILWDRTIFKMPEVYGEDVGVTLNLQYTAPSRRQIREAVADTIHVPQVPRYVLIRSTGSERIHRILWTGPDRLGFDPANIASERDA